MQRFSVCIEHTLLAQTRQGCKNNFITIFPVRPSPFIRGELYLRRCAFYRSESAVADNLSMDHLQAKDVDDHCARVIIISMFYGPLQCDLLSLDRNPGILLLTAVVAKKSHRHRRRLALNCNFVL